MKLKRAILTVLALTLLVGTLFVTASAAGTKNYAKIVTQPKNVLVASGEQARVTVEATGDGLTYKWYYKDKGASKFSISEAYKKDVYATGMSKDRDGRQVYCKITDKYGKTVTTKIVTLTRKNFAKIITQPKSVVVDSGEQAKVTVKATGDGLTYKWYYKNKGASKYTLAVASGNTFSAKMDSSKDGRQVYCKITDKYGKTVTTKTVTLKIKHFAKITAQPKSVLVDSGKDFKVTVKATGDGLTYKWYYKNKNASEFSLASSAKTNTYAVSAMAGKYDGRQLYCVVTDEYGTQVTTKTVTLKMKHYAEIKTQPKTAKAKDGAYAKVSVKATGDGLTYQWYFKEKGAKEYKLSTAYKGSSYSMKMSEKKSGSKAYCVITDKYGTSVKSDVVTLKLARKAIKATFDSSYYYSFTSWSGFVYCHSCDVYASGGTGEFSYTYEYFNNSGSTYPSYVAEDRGSSCSVQSAGSLGDLVIRITIKDTEGNSAIYKIDGSGNVLSYTTK